MAGTLTVYSGTEDGWILSSGSNWATVRDADSGGSVNSTSSSNAYGVRASVTTGRGGTTYYATRSFFSFDTSSINHIPKSGTIGIHGRTFGNTHMELVKSTHTIGGLGLSIADFDAIDGWGGASADGSGGGNEISNVTQYNSSTITSWNTGSYNSIVLSERALIHIAGLDTFKVCLIDSVHDLRDITPISSSNYSGMYYSNNTGTTKDPKLDLRTQDDAVFFGANF
jgi:hypothetical protein